MFRHPNYYKNLRKLARNSELHVRPISGSVDSATDQVISDGASTEATSVHPDPGPKLQAPSVKLQASSTKLLKKQATSVKPQATSIKLEAASIKLLDS